jgi:hypothetical protein
MNLWYQNKSGALVDLLAYEYICKYRNTKIKFFFNFVEDDKKKSDTRGYESEEERDDEYEKIKKILLG